MSDNQEAISLGRRERESALSLGPRKRACPPDPLVHHGRHFGRTVHAMTKVQALITNGLLRMADLAETPEESSTAEERKEHHVFMKLLHMVPGLEDRLMNGTEEEVVFIAELIQRGASSARSDDTKGLKGAVLDWITPRGQPLNPPLSRNVKIDRGFHHERTGALLCPSGLDWSNIEIKEKLRSGELSVKGDQWPIFIYHGYHYDSDDPWNGLLRSSLLVTAYKHIFTSPSSVDKEPKATRSGNARIHGMTQVTAPSIAYVATQVRFALTSSPVFSRTDTTTDSETFYTSMLDLLEDDNEKEEVKELLTWWNRQIFPNCTASQRPVTKNSVLARIKERRALLRSAQATSSNAVSMLDITPPDPYLPVDVFCTSNQKTLVALNTDVIWSRDLRQDKPAARVDGWWGPHEYAIIPQHLDRTSPYMAWIPSQASYNDCLFSEYTGLDSTLALISFVEYPLSITDDPSTSPPHIGLPLIAGLPTKPQHVNPYKTDHSLVSTSDEMRAVIREGVSALTADVRRAIDSIKDDNRYRSIRMPTQALFHLQQAYYWNMLPGTVTKIGHTLVLAGLKRAVYELHGFLLWIKDCDMPIETHSLQRFRRKPYSTRGVYVDNANDYYAIGQYGVAVYMEVDLNSTSLPPVARKISSSPIPNHRQPLLPLGYSGGHHTYIIFYPPTVENHSLFELAGRGYVSRLDQYEPNRQVEKIIDLMVRDTSEFACLFDVMDVQYAPEIAQGLFFPSLTRKNIAHHFRQQVEEELVGIQPFSPVPALYIWRSARQEMKWPPAHTGPGRPPRLVTAVPPPLMFFRCANADKQRSFFFIWICMRREWLYSFERTPYEARSSFLLTHQDWRQILSGERFKKAAKRAGKPYDLRYFWRSDPFFCDAKTAADEKLDLAPLIGNDIQLEPDHFLDTNEHAFTLKRIICYDITLMHISHQFNQADELYIREKNLGEHEMEKRRHDRASLFRETVTMRFYPPPWQSDVLGVRAAWFEKLRLLLLDWPAVCDAHSTASVIGMQEPEFSNEVYRLLVVYYSGIAIALNTIPTSMWTHPSPSGSGLWSYHLI